MTSESSILLTFPTSRDIQAITTVLCYAIGYRELQAQEALQNGQLSGGDGVPDLQPGVLASQAMIEKILGEDPRWQGKGRAVTFHLYITCKRIEWKIRFLSPLLAVSHLGNRWPKGI